MFQAGRARGEGVINKYPTPTTTRKFVSPLRKRVRDIRDMVPRPPRPTGYSYSNTILKQCQFFHIHWKLSDFQNQTLKSTWKLRLGTLFAQDDY